MDAQVLLFAIEEINVEDHKALFTSGIFFCFNRKI